MDVREQPVWIIQFRRSDARTQRWRTIGEGLFASGIVGAPHEMSPTTYSTCKAWLAERLSLGEPPFHWRILNVETGETERVR